MNPSFTRGHFGVESGCSWPGAAWCIWWHRRTVRANITAYRLSATPRSRPFREWLYGVAVHPGQPPLCSISVRHMVRHFKMYFLLKSFPKTFHEAKRNSTAVRDSGLWLCASRSRSPLPGVRRGRITILPCTKALHIRKKGRSARSAPSAQAVCTTCALSAWVCTLAAPSVDLDVTECRQREKP